MAIGAAHRQHREREVKFAMLTSTACHDNFQHLFFSEATVFQQYLNNGDLPLLTLESQVRAVLITKLPKSFDGTQADKILGILSLTLLPSLIIWVE